MDPVQKAIALLRRLEGEYKELVIQHANTCHELSDAKNEIQAERSMKNFYKKKSEDRDRINLSLFDENLALKAHINALETVGRKITATALEIWPDLLDGKRADIKDLSEMYGGK